MWGYFSVCIGTLVISFLLVCFDTQFFYWQNFEGSHVHYYVFSMYAEIGLKFIYKLKNIPVYINSQLSLPNAKVIGDYKTCIFDKYLCLIIIP